MIYGLYDPLDNLLYVGETTQEPKKALSSLWSKRSKRAGALGEWLRSLDEKPRVEVLEAGDTDAGRLDHWLDRVGRERLTNDKETFADVEVDRPRPDQDVPEDAENEAEDAAVISYTDEVAEFLATGKLRASEDTDQAREKPGTQVVVANDSMGNIEAHRAGCQHSKTIPSDGSLHRGTYLNQVEVAADYYDDQIAESDLSAADFVADIDFKPCLEDLPYDHLEDTETASEAVAEETVTEDVKKPRKPSALRGRKLSDEHRAKISAKLKGKPLSEEHKEKISRGQKGKKLSDEHKAKLSAAWERRRARKAAEKNGE